jgi:serine/threonine protein kinase
VLRIPGAPAADTGSIADVALQTQGGGWAQGSLSTGSGVRPEQKFSHYRIKRRLGAGAMGEVWLAFDTTLERDLAIKILPPSLGQDQERLLRFFREARLAAQLNHPNAVTIYQVGVEEGLPFLAMELVDGGSLEDRIREHGPLDWREATRVVRDAAVGLAEAHALGLVHRDIKPANLVQTSKGLTKVADFGLARATSQQSSLTSAGAPLGTPAYMPPEQWKGETVDGRSDLYSLICTYYFLLTGKPPFEAPSAPALGYQHSHVPFPDPRQQLPDLPATVCRILERGAQKKPELRHQSASELVDELDSLLAATSGGSGQGKSILRPIPLTAAAPSRGSGIWPPRNRGAWLAAAGAGMLMCGVIIYITSRGQTTKLKIDDPNAVVRVESSDVSGDSAEPTSAPVPGNDATVSPDEIPTFDDFAPPPPLPVWHDSVNAKDPIPYASLVAEAEEKIRADFKQRLTEGKLEASGKLAEELLTLAAAPVNQPAEQFAQLRLARTLAQEEKDLDQALQACNQLAKRFNVDDIRMRATTLSKCFRTGKWSPQEREAYTDHCFRLGFEAIGREDYRFVNAVTRLAQSVSEERVRGYVGVQGKFMAREAAAGKTGYERIRSLTEKLREQPDDPEANRATGLFLCLVKNDWQHGRPMLKRGDNPELVKLAGQELDSPTAHDEQVALGDSWWDAAGKQAPSDSDHAAGMRQRARHWYLKALGQLSPSERSGLTSRLQPRIDSVPMTPFALRIRMTRCDGPHDLEISNDGIETRSNKHGTRLVQINHLSWDHEVHKYSNTGASRLLPDAVDFGTAKIVRESAGQWGYISFRTRPDRFVLRCGHGPIGATDFDLIIVFQSQGFALANRFDGLWETKFYKWQKSDWSTASNSIRNTEGWDKLMLAGPVDTKVMDVLNYRSDAEPYIDPFRPRPLSDKISRDFYALVATSTWTVPAGDYEIVTRSDDGIRVFIDDKKVIDKWTIRGAEHDRATVTLSDAPHRLRVEYFQYDKHERLQFHMHRLGVN